MSRGGRYRSFKSTLVRLLNFKFGSSRILFVNFNDLRWGALYFFQFPTPWMPHPLMRSSVSSCDHFCLVRRGFPSLGWVWVWVCDWNGSPWTDEAMFGSSWTRGPGARFCSIWGRVKKKKSGWRGEGCRPPETGWCWKTRLCYVSTQQGFCSALKSFADFLLVSADHPQSVKGILLYMINSVATLQRPSCLIVYDMGTAA